MKAIVQRVLKASVSVNGEIVGRIGRGICVLVGISRDDTPKDAEFIIRKLINLRIFEDDVGKRWCKSVKDYEYEILSISQFTLHAQLKGNKPDFHQSMAPDLSEAFYADFLQKLKKAYKPELVQDGKFGALMQVEIVNDGPVTIELDSVREKQIKSDLLAKTSMEDVFNDEGEELDVKCFENLKSARLKDGYREGIDAGKEAKLQLGFDSGCQIGFRASHKVQKLKGTIRALQYRSSLTSSGNGHEQDLKRLNEAEIMLNQIQITLKDRLIESTKCLSLEDETSEENLTSSCCENSTRFIETELNQQLETIAKTCQEVLINFNVE